MKNRKKQPQQIMPPSEPPSPRMVSEMPRSLLLAQEGMHTSGQFAGVFSAMITDLLSGAITPGVGNAVCNAGGKLLKVVELQHKYGTKGANSRKQLQLCDPPAEKA